MSVQPLVLLIEPQKILAQTYQKALEYAGYEVEVVRDAGAAIVLADHRTPAVVILELRLPHHDGIEFLHEFRSYTEWQDVPVIIHTVLAPAKLAHVRSALRQDLGVPICLYKPQTSLERLIGSVRKVVPS